MVKLDFSKPTRRYRELEDENRMRRESDSRYKEDSIWKDRSLHAMIAFATVGILVAVVFVLSGS